MVPMSAKREFIYLSLIILLAGVAGQFWYTYRYVPEKEREIHVYYNRNEPLNKQVISTIRDADQFVYFAIYTFTRSDIKDTLLAAKQRGLDVQGIVDKEQKALIESQGKIVKELEAAGIPIYEQSHSSIMHLKTVVTEKAYASGSYNWTTSATESNDEVLEVGTDEGVRKQYQKILEGLMEKYK